MAIEPYDIKGRWTGEVLFTARIDVAPDMPPSVRLGLAVKWGVKERKSCARADLARANLAGAKNLKLPHFQLPEGDLIGWKALRYGVICKLRIPPEAKRTASIIGRKCRAEYVEVLEGEGYDKHTGETYYKAGEIVRPDSYDDNPLVECTHGIHFFATEAEAREWL